MKQDVAKLRQWIKMVKDGRISPSCYRTFLYCVRSHYRGRIHMKVWNKKHPYKLKLFDSSIPGVIAHAPMDPMLGSMELNSLEDQTKFIMHMVAYIKHERARADAQLKAGKDWYWVKEWAGLETNFDLSDVGTTDAIIAQPQKKESETS